MFFALATITSTMGGLLAGATVLTEAAFPSQAVTKAIIQAAPEQYSMILTKEIRLFIDDPVIFIANLFYLVCVNRR
jgi:hypothetical protein